MATAGPPGEGDGVIPLNENTDIVIPSDSQENQLALIQAQSNNADNEIVQLNEDTRVAIPSECGDQQIALPRQQPSIIVDQGCFPKAIFGPQTNTKNVTANDNRNATIHHHHYYPKSSEKPESSEKPKKETTKPEVSGPGARPKEKPSAAIEESDCVWICDDIYMYNKEPIRKGTRIYKGFQRHALGERPLAIKMIVPCEDVHLREVEHLLKLSSHPNVVQIIYSKVHQGNARELYIAMELCSPQNLQDYLNQNDEMEIPLDFEKTMSFTKQLVDGMKHIHRNKIVHRDLKPENILFSFDGDFLKLSDFGMSKELRYGCSVTKRSSQGLGTDGFRAPETYISDEISQSGDIYSLGLTFHCLWTNGKHAFGKDLQLWNFNIKNNVGRDLSGLPDGLGSKKEELLDLEDRMLEFEPQNRPTIEEVARHPFLTSARTFPKEVFTNDIDYRGEPSTSCTDVLHTRKRRPPSLPASWSDMETYKFDDAIPIWSSSVQTPILGAYKGSRSTSYSAMSFGTGASFASNMSYASGFGFYSDLMGNLHVSGEEQAVEAMEGQVLSLTIPERLEELGMDKDRLYECRLIVEHRKQSSVEVLGNLDKGYRLFCGGKSDTSLAVKVSINGSEKPVSVLRGMRLPIKQQFFDRKPTILKAIYPGVILWFDTTTQELFAMRFCDAEAWFTPITTPLDDSPTSTALTMGESIPILSLEECINEIENKFNDPDSPMGMPIGVSIFLKSGSSKKNKVEMKLFPYALEYHMENYKPQKKEVSGRKKILENVQFV